MFEFLGEITERMRFKKIIEAGAKTAISNKKLLEKEIKKWLDSPQRKMMQLGEAYYTGEHEILKRKREVIGEDGQLVEVENLPNNQIVDNQYAKLVDQKVNYLLAKPLTFETQNNEYLKQLQLIFNAKFHRTFRNLGEDSLNGGIAWLYVFYDEQGNLAFKRFPPYEVLPFWKDADHTELEFAVRLYPVSAYEGDKEVIIHKVELYTTDGIEHYVWQKNSLVRDVEQEKTTYITTTDENDEVLGLNWERVPLIAFKYSNKGLPLIKRVKSLQDGINIMLSDFENNMQENAHNTILVLENYDGQNLGEFRRNLAQFGVVKVRSSEGSRGDLRTLSITVNAENYKAILSLFKKAMIENGRGYDAKDERMSNNPNQMNIQSMYSDIDLDANGIETEYQASFEDLLWFVNVHLTNNHKGDFDEEHVNVIFNRDILVNESESIKNAVDSMPILSMESIVAQHPWTKNLQLELDRKEKERQKEQQEFDDYRNNFPNKLLGGNTSGQE
ncbi:phage portal protein [Lysinibacillus xylanilyticus]|uniref:phage portal protein n=1 Tax=Lysinibacillus xylanilyticus TaxID=582475 RepID=UPI003D04CA24